jgi:ribosomal protein S1
MPHRSFDVRSKLTLRTSGTTARRKLMKTNQPNNNVEESTYALLVRSEEKKRGLFETIVYGLVILSAVAAILQFADQPILFGR